MQVLRKPTKTKNSGLYSKAISDYTFTAARGAVKCWAKICVCNGVEMLDEMSLATNYWFAINRRHLCSCISCLVGILGALYAIGPLYTWSAYFPYQELNYDWRHHSGKYSKASGLGHTRCSPCWERPKARFTHCSYWWIYLIYFLIYLFL